MQKENQSILDILQRLPMSSFLINKSSLSNKEAQTLYDLWKNNETDEYGKIIVEPEADVSNITSLTSNGYIRNIPTRYALGVPNLLEITNKGKDVIKKIILHQEKSAFDKKTAKIDYEAISRSAELEELKSEGKFASKQKQISKTNWLTKLISQEINKC